MQMSSRIKCVVFSVLLWTSVCSTSAIRAQVSSRPTQHTFFHVSLENPTSGTVSGRLLLFIAPPTANSTSVDVDMMSPASVYVAAKEVLHLEPGESIDIDADDLVFPSAFSTAPAGEYRVQAVLDIHHSYNYNGRAPGDLLSVPISIQRTIDARSYAGALASSSRTA